MSGWPPIAEQELLDRLAMDDAQFAAFMQTFVEAIPPRAYAPEALALALGYPWERPPGSYLLRDGEAQLLAALDAPARERLIHDFSAPGSGRAPLLAIGSNAAPEALERKFAHFPDAADRAVLAVCGRLHEFDVGCSPQPAVYGALPATIFPSPGTAVAATLLWVTQTQFTQLAWTELSYRLGRLRTRFVVDDAEDVFDEVLVFVSRFGAFCPRGEPVALAAVPARGRTAEALTQERLLDVAAAIALGPQATAETLVRAVYEDVRGLVERSIATLRPLGRPFASERWTPWAQR